MATKHHSNTPLPLSRRESIGGGLAMACLLSASPAFAHRLARSETEVVLHESGLVDVTHIFHVHDVQRAFFEAGLISRPDMSSLNARARLALHTKNSFKLISEDTEIVLDVINAEIIGHHVYVYQEGLAPKSLTTVWANMLQDYISDQINSINIVQNGKTMTLDFRGEDGPKPVA